MFDELQIGSPMTEKRFEEVTLSELRNLITSEMNGTRLDQGVSVNILDNLIIIIAPSFSPVLWDDFGHSQMSSSSI